MRFSFSWPLLGLVIERPSYGYELISRFERIYGEVLVVTAKRRIYDALEELEGRHLIEQVEGVETDHRAPRRPRIHYQATGLGRVAYQEWLLEEMSQERERARLFARQLSMLPRDAALDVLDRYERECLDEAATIEATADRTQEQRAATFLERLTHEEERLTLEVKLAWFQYARRELNAFQRTHPSAHAGAMA